MMLAALKTEIQTDPAAVGYGTWATVADDARIQALLCDRTKRPLAAVLVDSWRVVQCFDSTEFASRTALQQAQLATLLSGGQVNLASAGVRSMALAIFPSAGPTRTALTALWASQQQTQSRADETGLGGTVADVTAARLS